MPLFWQECCVHDLLEGPGAFGRKDAGVQPGFPLGPQYGVTVGVHENAGQFVLQAGAALQPARDLASLFGNGEPPAPATTRRLKTPFQQVDEQDFEAGEQLVFICLPGLLDLVCQIDQIQTCKMS